MDMKKFWKMVLCTANIKKCFLFPNINCFFKIDNAELKQDIGIPMEIYPALFWANLFLYFFTLTYIKNSVSFGSAREFKCHGTFSYNVITCARLCLKKANVATDEGKDRNET